MNLMSNARNTRYAAFIASLPALDRHTIEIVEVPGARWNRWNIEVNGEIALSDVEPGTYVSKARFLTSAMRRAGLKVKWLGIKYAAVSFS